MSADPFNDDDGAFPPGATKERPLQLVKPKDEKPSGWPEPLNLAELAASEPEKPRFVMDPWLPCGYATGIWGHGGVGKSGIALHLAVCIATGTPFFGLGVEQRRVLYLSCEDRENVLHWRLSRICKHLGIDMASLAENLQVLDLVGHEVVLWEKDPRTGGTFTVAFSELEERVRVHSIELVVVDGISDTYGGNENARTEIKRYINRIVSVIPPDRGALLVVGHIAKPTASNADTTEGYSGSTAWHNSVRARWYLYPETVKADDGGKSERTGDLILELQKSNFGPIDREMRFAWDQEAHLFIGRQAEAQSRLERSIIERTELEGIRRAIKGCMDAGLYVPAAAQGRSTAYGTLSLRPEFPDSIKGGGRPKTRRFERHIETLRQIRHIEESSYRRSNRHIVATLVLTTEGCAECV